MAILKEPEGITFYVENRELTVEEKKLLSEFIASQREKNKRRMELSKKTKSRKRKIQTKKKSKL